jgi:aspartate carbamoyltransferase catalytic subunit
VEAPASRIFRQMENGVFVRMSILEWILKRDLQ